MLNTLIKTLIVDKCIDVLFNRVMNNFTSNNIFGKGCDLQPWHDGMHIKVMCPITRSLVTFEGRVILQQGRDLRGVNYLRYLLYDIKNNYYLGEVDDDYDITFL